MATWKEIRDRQIGNDPVRQERVRIERALLDLEVALAELRQRRGLSQTSLAEVLGTSQANVSRIEREDDVQLSTLVGYLAGMGARLEMTAVFEDEHVPLTAGIGRSAAANTNGKGVTLMATSKNDTDRYVVPNKERGGWDVKKENAHRASAHTKTQGAAINRAREIVKNEGGGEIRIHDRDGDFRDSDTVKGPKHRESPARDRK